MIALSAILDRIRTKKAEIQLSAADEYFQLVRAVAGGKEIDADDAASIIDAHGKTSEDFESDVATQSKRIELANQYALKRQRELEVPKLEAELEKAKRELDAAIAKLQPLVFQADERLKAAHREALFHSTSADELRRTCLDPAILSRDAELKKTRLELVRKKTPLSEDLRRAQNQLRSWQNQVSNFAEAIKKNRFDYASKAADARGLESARAAVEELESEVAQLSAAIERLDSELRPIESELKELDAKKLIP